MSEQAQTGAVETIVASAGTGKTYSLVERIADQIQQGLEPDRLLATTFTKRAAAELQARIREKLIGRGRADLAAGLLAARLGTVNSVCGGLVSDFAFELGRSPAVDVIPESRQSAVFAEAATASFAACAGEISELAGRFGIGEEDYTSPHTGVTSRGWRDDVRRIVQVARINGFEPADLPASADRSVETLLALLPPQGAGETKAGLDAALEAAVRSASAQAEARRATLLKGTVNKDLPRLAEALACFDRGELLDWPRWAGLTKLGEVKADEALFYDVVAAARAHEAHPRLKEEIGRYVRALFTCAAQTMQAFCDFKAQRGYLDFVDQERLALEILQNDALAPQLREKIGAVFVDEFQDSSPIQIALFSALAQIAPRNAWVGDPKQSIFGFRDADPELTSQAWRGVSAAAGCEPTYLDTSRRLRPALGTFVNHAFEPNFTAMGLSRREICFAEHARTEPEGLPSPLAHWALQGSNKEKRANALAHGVDTLLRNRADWPLPNKDGQTMRPPRGGDVAILCRMSSAVEQTARALARRGLKAAVARKGLMTALEVEFVMAALRLTADSSDLLAAAELVRLCAGETDWLEAAFEDNPRQALLAHVPFTRELDAVRARGLLLTPSEALDAVIHAPGLLDVVRSWGDPEERLDRIEALRWRARTFEDEQRSARKPATLAGLCSWLADPEASQPLSRDPEAVHVLTYHSAKGLEWPVVVLTELESKGRDDPFGLHVEKTADPDWRNPLVGRWLRYWPWPYGGHEKGVGLEVTAPASAVGQAVRAAELAERTRLLYVGATRAKDYLILATTGQECCWLNELKDGLGACAVELRPDAIVACGENHKARSASFDEGLDSISPPAARALFGPSWPQTPAARLPLSLKPSAAGSTAALAVAETVALGPRIALLGDPDMQRVGEACHRFVAADSPRLTGEARLVLAERVLRRWGVPNLSAADMVTVGDRLRAFIQERFPGGVIRREWPLTAAEGEQLIEGRIDLMVEWEGQLVILDHKAFPGVMDPEGDRLKSFWGQAGLYARGLCAVHGARPVQIWLHQPIAGRMLRVEMTSETPPQASELEIG